MCPICGGPLRFDYFGTWCHRCGRNPERGFVKQTVGLIFPDVGNQPAETIMDRTEDNRKERLEAERKQNKFLCSINGCPNPAVRLYYMPEGCYCKADTYQGLCEQHEITAEGNPMSLLMTLAEPLRCADCKLLYSSDNWCDCVVSDEVWKKIEGGKPCVLCFNCMAGRLVKLGMEKVPVTIRSGPFLLAYDDSDYKKTVEVLLNYIERTEKNWKQQNWKRLPGNPVDTAESFISEWNMEEIQKLISEARGVLSARELK